MAQEVPKDKKIRTIAGVKVALTPGIPYSVAIPGNYKGPIEIFVMEVRKDKTPVRGRTVLRADLAQEKRKAFGEEFPACVPW